MGWGFQRPREPRFLLSPSLWWVVNTLCISRRPRGQEGQLTQNCLFELRLAQTSRRIITMARATFTIWMVMVFKQPGTPSRHHRSGNAKTMTERLEALMANLPAILTAALAEEGQMTRLTTVVPRCLRVVLRPAQCLRNHIPPFSPQSLRWSCCSTISSP